MRRWLSLPVVFLALFAIAVFGEGASRSTGANAGRTNVQEPLMVRVVPFGPTQAMIDTTSSDLLKRPQVQAYLKGARNRLLAFELLEPDDKSLQRTPPSRYRATFYDYTRNRAVIVEGSFERPDEVEASVIDGQPLPSREEFDAAVEILQQHPTIGPALRNKSLIPYPPMPPLVNEDAGNRVDRTLAVGLLPGSVAGDSRRTGIASTHEIVGVNMIRQTAIRFRGGAPRAAAVGVFACGVPNAGQSTTPRGTAGQYQLTVTQGGTELWNLLVVRPSASSGTRGSGVELRSVLYRGKSVLKRAHVPILNVKYENNTCGPYRDWQYQEGTFVADGSDVAPGIRLTATQPQTVLDNLTDTGNFRGVAIYVTPDEVTLVSELEAGWYRYISEWHLLSNGTIQPRFGFGGTQNGCVCNTHYHHAFWRFDFDIADANNNIVAEESASLTLKEWTVRYFYGTEAKRFRNADNPRRWVIRNTITGAGYTVLPGKEDGFASTYARGDVWVLFYRSTELDDGRNSTGTNTEADLDKFINGESVENKDVVLWYRGGFDHAPGSNESNPPRHSEGPEVVGPDLIPSNW